MGLLIPYRNAMAPRNNSCLRVETLSLKKKPINRLTLELSVMISLKIDISSNRLMIFVFPYRFFQSFWVSGFIAPLFAPGVFLISAIF